MGNSGGGGFSKSGNGGQFNKSFEGQHDNGWNYHNGHYGYWRNGGWGYWQNGVWIVDPTYEGVYTVQRPIINFSGAPIKIVNPLGNRVALSYTLNGMTYTIQPGFSQEFAEDRDWAIDFSRGPNLGEALYGCTPVCINFAPEGGGWELFNLPVTVSALAWAWRILRLRQVCR